MRYLIVFAVVVFSVFGVMKAEAATPSLSLALTSGDSVRVTVQGDANSGVIFYYNIGNVSLGRTDSSGVFGVEMSTSAYAVNPGSQVYVIVNGQQSSSQTWAYGAGSSNATVSGSPVFSQSSVTVGLGQSSVVVSQGNSTGVYVASNPSPTIASINANGTQITVTGNQIGSATARICYVGSASNCSNLFVTVQAGGVGILSFSQNNINLVPGQNYSVNVTGGSGNYTIMSNSNSSAVQVRISGTYVILDSFNPGSTAVVVCSSGTSVCGTLAVMVNSQNTNTPAVTFGVSSSTLTIGQSMNIALFGSPSYFISSNPSPNIVQASISGTALILSGVNAGSATITVCANSGGCNTFPVAVTVPVTPPVLPLAPPILPPQVPGFTVTTTTILSEIQIMQSRLTQILAEIQSMQTKLTQLIASIMGTLPKPPLTNQTKFQFYLTLSIGSDGVDVTTLQNRLKEEGFYSGPVTGFFGSLTKEAVIEYQSAKGLTPSGILDPATRSSLNR